MSQVCQTANVTSRLVVLGSCGAWPEPGRACSGFVLEHGGVRIVLDLGYGTLPRLLTLLGSTAADGIDAVIVTHAHPDHMVDLHGLFRARWFGRRGVPAIPLFAPESVVARLLGLEDDGEEEVRKVFDWRPLPAAAQEIGPLRLESMLLPHYVPNAGVRLTAPGLTLAYTGDTGTDPVLAELGRGADLFIVDATDSAQRRGGRSASTEPTLTLTARHRAPRPPRSFPERSCSPTRALRCRSAERFDHRRRAPGAGLRRSLTSEPRRRIRPGRPRSA